MSDLDNNNMLQLACDTAKEQMLPSIRAALRETAIQIIQNYAEKRYVVTNENGNDEGNTGNNKVITEVVITEDVINKVKSVCTIVAKKWSEKLRHVGHVTASNWVQEIATSEVETLFYKADQDNNDTTIINKDNIDNNQNHVIERQENEKETELEEADTNQEKTEVADTVTAWAKLRRLCEQKHKKNNLNDDTNTDTSDSILQEAINCLDYLGENDLSYWPKGQWHIIQQAANNIPQRLHGYKVTERRSVEEENAELLLSSSNNDNNNSEIMQLLLDRKRKSAYKKRSNKLPPKRQKNTNDEFGYDNELLEVQPRPPSKDNGTIRITRDDIVNGWNALEKEQLDSMLHDVTNTEGEDHDNERSFLLIGALRDIGRFHYFIQQPIDYPNNNNNNNTNNNKKIITDKQQRRRQRDAIQTRLGNNHILLRDDTVDKKKRMTKVIRTIIEQPYYYRKTIDNNNSAGKYWIHFDLGQCILDGIINSEGQRNLYAFSNVEVLLEDEDPPKRGIENISMI